MQKYNSLFAQYAPVVLRFGMAAVFLWFGFAQWIDPTMWTAYVPDGAVEFSGISALTLVGINAAFEIVFGILLVLGWKTRLVALLLSLHMFEIMYVVGYGEIGVRDFGLAVATLVVAMQGSDILCLDKKDTVY
jgi:uncharacterized membrane protein YphA (DoxX/SURF4 family)